MHLDMRINGTTVLTGLIGNPVAHTVSPVLQNSFFTAMGINGVYLPLRVPAGSIGEAVKGLKAVGFAGFNVTIPYKYDVIELADEISEEVKLLGAANTIKILNGKLYACNTDADGFARSFEEQTGIGFEGKNVCVLGAGGTAKALAVKIALKGARLVNIINRTEIRAVELAVNINSVLTGRGSAGKVAFATEYGSEEALRQLNECDIIVNTTSVGMYPDVDRCPLPQEFVFQSRQIVYDTIYNPSQTVLLGNAKACGCKTVNGAGMLFHQGLKAFEIWTETAVPQDISNALLIKFLKFLNG